MAFKVKKTTATVDAVLGTGAASFSKALSALTEGVDQLKGLEARADELTLLISNQENKISELQSDFASLKTAQDQEFTERKRAYDVQFKLDVQENEDKFVANWLTKRGLVTTTQTALDATTTELSTLKAEFADKVNSEVRKAVAIAQNGFSSDLKLKEAEFKAAEAANSAEITNLKNQNSFLTTQVEYWKGQLEAERNAGIERAKAGAINNLNLQAATGK